MKAFCEKRFRLSDELRKELVEKHSDDGGWVVDYFSYGVRFLGNSDPYREEFVLLLGNNFHPFGWKIELEMPYYADGKFHLGLDIYGGEKLYVDIWGMDWENIGMSFDNKNVVWIFKDTGERLSDPFERLNRYHEDNQILIAQYGKKLPKGVWQRIEPLYPQLHEFYHQCCSEWFKVVKP